MHLLATHRIISLLVLSLVAVAILTAQTQTPQITTVFVGVNVIPMTTEIILLDQSVVIRDGIIAEIGASRKVKIPKGSTVIPASGMFLMPGLADMHFHINDATGVLLDQTFTSLIAAGVTTVRDMNGFLGHLKLRDEIRQHKRFGPTIFAAGRITDNRKLRPYFRIVTTPQEARQAVIDDKNAGYDLFKVYSLLSSENYAAIVDEARKLNMPVVGHVPESVGLAGALKTKQSSIEHLFSYCEAARRPGVKDSDDLRELFHAVEIDESQLPSLARATRKAGTWNVPTLYYSRNRLPFEGARKAWEQPGLRALGERNRKLLVQAFRDAGAGILLGTDSSASWHLVPGFSTHEELKILVEFGLTPYQTLRTGTIDAAKFMGSSKFGTIEKGKRADLIMLRSNPIQNINNIQDRAGVMVRGQWYSSETLSQMLAKLELNADGTRRQK